MNKPLRVTALTHKPLRVIACTLLALLLVVCQVPSRAFADTALVPDAVGAQAGDDGLSAVASGGSSAPSAAPVAQPSTQGGLSVMEDGDGGDPGDGGTDPGGGGDNGGDPDPGTDPGGTDPGGSDPGGGGTENPGGGDSGGGDNPGDNNPGGGGSREPEEGNEGEGDNPEPPAATYVGSLLIKDDVSGHYLGESFDPGENNQYLEPTILVKGETRQFYPYYHTTSDPHTIYSAADPQSPMGSVTIIWSTSDESIATISPSGEFIARGNGDVVITATVNDSSKYADGEAAPLKRVTFHIDGQSGEYVTDVSIIDENGNDVGIKSGGHTTVFNKTNMFYQFTARVTWADADGQVLRVEDTSVGDAISSSIIWAVGGNESIATINADSGRLRTSSYSGNAYVVCTVTGGVGGSLVTDTARVQLDTGVYEYNPAESLTLRIFYEEFPDTVVQEHTYAYSELIGALPSYSYNYSMLGGHGGVSYGWIKATGFLFKDIMDMEGVKMEEVLQFRFITADGYDNPVSYQKLYGSGNRYYFPNWDISSRAGAQVVPPMLAYVSFSLWGQSEVDPSIAADEATRFRLVFGPLWEGESNSSYQIMYIRGINIVLKGAPPADDGIGEDKDGTGTKPGDDDGGGGRGTVGIGGGSTGEDSGGTRGRSDGSTTDDASQGNANDMAGLTGEGESGNLSANSGGSGGYRVYEMLSRAQSQVEELVFDNPLAPFVVPFVIGDLVLGFTATWWGFQRRSRRFIIDTPVPAAG